MSKLQKAAKLIEDEHRVETRVLAVDFADKPENYCRAILKEITDLDIGVLVNNVGVNCDYPDEFLNIDREMVKSIIDVNIIATTAVTEVPKVPI